MKKIFILATVFLILQFQTNAQSAYFTSDSPRCLNDTVHFSPGAPGGTILLEDWDFGDGAVSTYAPPTTFPVFATHVYVSPGTYTVTRTVKFTSGILSYNVQVQVIPLPTANFTFPGTLCTGQSALFTDLSSTSYGSIVKWVWDFGDGTPPVVIIFPSNPNIAHTFAGSALAHNVMLTVTTSNGCTSSITKLVTSTPNPLANFSFPASNCVSQQVQFTDLSQTNGGGAIVAWNWNFGDPAAGINNTSTLQNPVHIFMASGTYTVSLTVTNANGCTNSIIKMVAINTSPVADFFFITACAGSPVTFTDASIANAPAIISYSWNFGDGGTSSLSSPAHIYATYGLYIVTLTVVNSNGCTSSITKPVTVNPKPVAEFTFPATNCFGSAVSYTDQSYIPSGFSLNIIYWAWDFGDGTPPIVINFPGNPNVTHTFLGAATSHVVRLTVTSSTYCSSYIDKIVTSIPAPVANFSFPPLNCAYQPVLFTDLSQTNGGGYIVAWSWNFGDPASGSGNTSSAQNPTHIFTSAGIFFVSLVVANNDGCRDTIMKVLPVNVHPVSNFMADTVFQGTATTFTDLSYSTSGVIASRVWDFGDGQTSQASNPSHLYGTAGIFAAKLTVTDNNGCIKDTTKPVMVKVNPISAPPASRTITNVIIGNNQTNCYNATQLITTAGNGTMFIILSGGSATLISGQTISLLPTTTVQLGGYLWGYIAPNGPWCLNPSMPAVVTDNGQAFSDSLEGFSLHSGQSGFKVYPNPTTGNFTLELPAELPPKRVNVDLFGLWGDKLGTYIRCGEGKHSFSLSGRQPGVYFIRIISGEKAVTFRIIKK